MCVWLFWILALLKYFTWNCNQLKAYMKSLSFMRYKFKLCDLQIKLVFYSLSTWRSTSSDWVDKEDFASRADTRKKIERKNLKAKLCLHFLSRKKMRAERMHSSENTRLLGMFVRRIQVTWNYVIIACNFVEMEVIKYIS